MFFFFKEHPSGEQGDIIFLDTPVYNKNIYLVTFASLRPEQLFSSGKHSSFQAGKGKCAARSFWSCQRARGGGSGAASCNLQAAGGQAQPRAEKQDKLFQGKDQPKRLVSLGWEEQVRSNGQSLFGRALEDPGGVKVHSCHCTFLKAGSGKRISKNHPSLLCDTNSLGQVFWLSGKCFLSLGGEILDTGDRLYPLQVRPSLPEE